MSDHTNNGIQMPFEHLNEINLGTLADHYSEARAAIYTARRYLSAVDGNASDHHHLSENTLNLSSAARVTALAQLDHVADYVEAYLEHLFNQLE